MADLIDRQAAIKAIEDLPNCYNGFSDTYDKSCIIGVLEELPSAQRTGRWIVDDEFIDCSSCRAEKWSRTPYESLVKRFRFCPNCGAQMEVEE